MRIAWFINEKCWVDIVKMTPDFSLIKYASNGFDFEEWVENDDLVYPEDMGIDYESDF